MTWWVVRRGATPRSRVYLGRGSSGSQHVKAAASGSIVEGAPSACPPRHRGRPSPVVDVTRHVTHLAEIRCLGVAERFRIRIPTRKVLSSIPCGDVGWRNAQIGVGCQTPRIRWGLDARISMVGMVAHPARMTPVGNENRGSHDLAVGIGASHPDLAGSAMRSGQAPERCDVLCLAAFHGQDSA